MNRLAKSKHKTDQLLAEKRHALQTTVKEKKEELTKGSNNKEQLERELRITTAALEESRAREKQVTINVLFRKIL